MRGIGERDETSILDEVRRAFGVVGFSLRAKAGSSTVPKRRKRRFGFARNDNVGGGGIFPPFRKGREMVGHPGNGSE
jgi:hypothetical protein